MHKKWVATEKKLKSYASVLTKTYNKMTLKILIQTKSFYGKTIYLRHFLCVAKTNYQKTAYS